MADQTTRANAARRHYNKQFTDLARDIVNLRTEAVIAVLPLNATADVSKQLTEYLSVCLLSALNDTILGVAQNIRIIDRSATGVACSRRAFTRP